MYDWKTYCNPKRWETYYEQIDLCHRIFEIDDNPEGISVLVVGPGDHIVPAVLKHQGFFVDTFDIKGGSTYHGDVKDIGNIVKRKYDIVLCCEVLEHVDFGYVRSIIESLESICERRLIISVPKFEKTKCKWHRWELYKPNTPDITSEFLSYMDGYETEWVRSKEFFIKDIDKQNL